MTILTSRVLEFDDSSQVYDEYFSRGWTDGLPIIPPTQERVEECLNVGHYSPTDLIGTEPTKGRVITAEKVAINTVMAGCLPEYFPVVVTAVEAMCEPEFNLHAITASTMGAAVLLVVGGPIVSEIGINSGVSVFGPGHRANAPIGRAIRLVIINATGSASGEIDKATLGHAGKYTWCMAEASSISPWQPLHVDRGFSDHESVVTIFAALSGIQVANHESQDPKEILNSFRDGMFAVGPMHGELNVVLCPEHVTHFKKAGWSKDQVKRTLFDISQRPSDEWKAAGAQFTDDQVSNSGMIPTMVRPENINVLVAGGTAGAFSSIIPLWTAGNSTRSVTKAIR